MNVVCHDKSGLSPSQREEERGFLFVSGCKRSATEFLNHSFDSHPLLLNVVVEFYAFEYLARNMDLADVIVAFADAAPVSEVYDSFRRRSFLPCFDRRNVRPGAWPDPELEDEVHFELDFDKDQFLEAFDKARSGGLGSIAGLIRTWFACLKQTAPFNRQPDARWLLKCADFGLTLQAANQLGLLDRAAFSARHPLAILNSIKRMRMQEEHRDFHIFQMLEVCRAMEAIPDILETLGSGVRTFRYEDLVPVTRQVLGELAENWGVGDDPALDQPTVVGQPWRTNSSFGGDGKQTVVLTESEQWIILSHTKKFMRTFGYSDEKLA